MKKFIGLILILSLVCSFIFAKDVKVSGYYRKDGTYVRAHYRTSPNSTVTDNYSYLGISKIIEGDQDVGGTINRSCLTDDSAHILFGQFPFSLKGYLNGHEVICSDRTMNLDQVASFLEGSSLDYRLISQDEKEAIGVNGNVWMQEDTSTTDKYLYLIALEESPKFDVDYYSIKQGITKDIGDVRMENNHIYIWALPNFESSVEELLVDGNFRFNKVSSFNRKRI